MPAPTFHCAVMGNPIAHSKSPTIHGLFAQSCGLSMQYDKICVPIDDFSSHVLAFFKNGGHGLNITIPFKQMAFELPQLDISERAQNAKAINTLWFQNGQLYGCNTDGIGLVRDLHRQQIATQQKHILIVGAGGATRGIIGPLLQDGRCAEITIVNRTPEKAYQLVEDLSVFQGSLHATEFHALRPAYDLIINASASGMHQTILPIGDSVFANASAAVDLFYQATPTTFLQQAQAAGVTRCIDGLGMLVEQAAESFFIWTQQRPQTDAVHSYLRSQL